MTSETEQPQRRSGSWTAPVLCVGIALMAFVATAALIRDRVPVDEGLLAAKREAFEAEKETITTVYIGSSLVHRHVVPELIDDHLQAEGVTSSSYNFGAPRMSWPEAVRIADWLIATRPPALRTVVVEMHLFVPTPRNEGSDRYTDWHTLPETYWSVLRLLEEKPRGEARRRRIESELRAFGKRVASVGHLARAFRATWDPDADADRVDLEPDARGYEPVENEHTGAAAARHRRFVRRTKAFERDVERARNGRASKPLSPYAATMLYRLVTRLADAGYDVIVLEMPHINRSELTVPEAIHERALVMSMYDPRIYGALYATPLHYDRVHLRDEGARLASMLLARRLARVFRQDVGD